MFFHIAVYRRKSGLFNHNSQRSEKIYHIGIGKEGSLYFVFSRVHRIAPCMGEVGFFEIASAEHGIGKFRLCKIGTLQVCFCEFTVLNTAFGKTLIFKVGFTEITVTYNRFSKVRIELIPVTVGKIDSLKPAALELTVGKTGAVYFNKGQFAVFKYTASENTVGKVAVAETAVSEMAVLEAFTGQLFGVEVRFFKVFIFKVFNVGIG